VILVISVGSTDNSPVGLIATAGAPPVKELVRIIAPELAASVISTTLLAVVSIFVRTNTVLARISTYACGAASKVLGSFAEPTTFATAIPIALWTARD
jgi:hypothetical protein